MEREKTDYKGKQEPFEVKEMFCILILLVITQ